MSLLTQIAGYLFVILLPILAFYIIYLVVTKAFREMGFTTFEAVIIVFASFLLGSGIIDGFAGITFSNIPLFTYDAYWVIGINVGGAVIPILLSLYLTIRHKLKLSSIILGIAIVALMTFLVTYPDPEKGIVSQFPYWLVPVVGASIVSIILCWRQKRNAAPLAYTIGTLGVLVGADVFHLIRLVQMPVESTRYAVIGGANIFDMVFITGILAVFIDGVLLYQQKTKKGEKEK